MNFNFFFRFFLNIHISGYYLSDAPEKKKKCILEVKVLPKEINK